MTASAVERSVAAARQAWGSHWTPELVARAPGRLELLGNHVDYNGGPVLASAIDRDVVCLVRKCDEPDIRVLMADASAAMETLDPNLLGEWSRHGEGLSPSDYVRGVMACGLARGGGIRTGVELSIAGDVPIGFGLSSSAALCVAATLALHLDAPAGRELVLRAQEAEHRAGTPCGTMDQSASVGGNVILYDGASVTWESLTPDLGSYVFAVADSGVARSLSTSSYPIRVEESQEALKLANALLGTTHPNLASLSNEELSVVLASSISPVLKRRVRHIVTEVERVRAGISAMNAADWRQFGQLMSESGISSAIDYEISHPTVEAIVAAARGVNGVLGARMMGGGEGGTALILLHMDAIDGLRTKLQSYCYHEREMSADDAVRVFQFAPGASVEQVATQ